MQVTTNELATTESAGVPVRQVDVNTVPNVCPICHVTIEPEIVNGPPGVSGFDWMEIYYRCTNKKCRRHFTALFRYVGQRGQFAGYDYERSVPSEPEIPEFVEVIKTISPDFVRVYSQALGAEAYALTDVAGPGFRKALEFLVKDYAIHLKPEAFEEIKAAPLARVIEQHLTGDKVPVVSLRAAWIGNDQTHYERRWVDKDLLYLKTLIGATVHFIAMEEMVVDLPRSMPKAQK